MQDQSSTDVIWAAGLFEGEGCFSTHRRQSGKQQVQARLRMIDQDVVERFAVTMDCGTVRGPIFDGRENHKPTWEWYTQDALNVRAVIAMLLPYLGERRTAKALEVDAIAATIRPHNQKLTHCPHGHEMTDDNVRLETIKRASGIYTARRCKTCRQSQERDRARAKLGISPDRFRV